MRALFPGNITELLNGTAQTKMSVLLTELEKQELLRSWK